MNGAQNKPDRFWDFFARRYDRRAEKDGDSARSVQRFAGCLKSDDTVLDYACGPGVISSKVAVCVSQVLGIDTSSRMIALARERAERLGLANVHFAEKTIFDTGLANESFDVILAFNILHLLEDAQSAVERAGELLKPSGLLVCDTPCLGQAGAVMRGLLPVLARLVGISHLRALRIEDLQQLIQRAGFELLQWEVPEGRIPSCFAVARKQS